MARLLAFMLRLENWHLVTFFSLLAVILSIVSTNLLWPLLVGPVPDGMTLVTTVAATLLAPPLAQMLVLPLKDLKRSYAELARTRDELATLNDRLEARVRERTTELEEAVAIAESANAAKSAFLANMSHELRTPLNGVIGYAEMIVAREALFGDMAPGKIDEYADAILSSGRHLNAMVSDLLDLSRVEAGEYVMTLEPACARRIVRDAVKELAPAAATRGQTIDVVIPEDAPMIQADTQAVRQIITNLLSNSLKYSADGDRVTVTVDQMPEATRFIVRDTGIGMSADAITEATRPFSKFSNAHIAAGQSIGLGLSIVKRLCDLLDARFTMASVEGSGTVACIDMPTRPAGSGSESGQDGALALAG